jgi:hypothetical protein
MTEPKSSKFFDYLKSDHFNMVTWRLITISFSVAVCGRLGLAGAFHLETQQLMLDNSIVKSQISQLQGTQKTEKSKLLIENIETLETIDKAKKYNLAMLVLELFLLIHFFKKFDKAVEDYNNSKAPKEDPAGPE